MIRGFVFVFGYLLHYLFGNGNGENMKRLLLIRNRRSSACVHTYK